MRKILILCVSIIVSFTNLSAAELTESEKKSAYKIAKSIEKIVNNKTPRHKNAWHLKLSNVLKKIDKNGKKYVLISEVLKIHLQMDFSPYIHKHYTEYKINKNIIDRYWLNLHNNARKQRGLPNYSYDQRLNNTAIEWSYNNYNKSSMDHKRDIYDDWYDYYKIEDWFQDRGVNCKVKGRTTTSESIGKFGFYCTDGECSEELKTSLKAIFDVYMAEENLLYPENAHYKAIVSPNISKIGLGITLYKADLRDYYEYYMTTHYCTEFK